MIKKNPHAVALGRLGGKARAKALSREEIKAIASKAGKARLQKLTFEQRSAIAKRAVQAREQKRKERKNG